MWVFMVNREPLRLLIFREWKISTMDRVRNAIVVPSALSTNSHDAAFNVMAYNIGNHYKDRLQ